MESWHIACPGPSLTWDWFDDDDASPIVCVNLALLEAPRCDWWVCLDLPNEVHKTCSARYDELRPRVVTGGKRQVKSWHERYGAVDVDSVEPLFEAATWIQARSYSVFGAIALAVHGGAKRVTFHGVDLAGENYFRGLNPRQKTINWERRWKMKEVKPLRRIVSEAGARGIEITGLPERVYAT